MEVKTTGRILILDDDPDVLYTAKLLLKKYYSQVVTEENPQALPSLLKTGKFDLVVLDMNFSPGSTTGKEGFIWLKYILKVNPEALVILSTAYGDIDLAVEAMREGAVDFLVKPWTNEKLLEQVNRAFRLKHQFSSEKKEIIKPEKDTFLPVLKYKSAVIRKILSDLEKVAATDASILITGENGTGKDLVARQIHELSGRAANPFVKVDLGAIPETLFDSEISGHTKGAFTDARESRAGRVEAADKGTLFLDEIGNLPVQLQSKLLTILQNKQVVRVGSNEPVIVDFRLVSATNRNLTEMVSRTAFRQDLLYRINTIEIHLPPLRDRIEDIPVLLHHFLEIYGHMYDKPGIQIRPEVIKHLQKYHWPGNIRELQHAVERAVILAESTILEAGNFNLTGKPSLAIKTDSFNVEKLEKSAMENAIKKHGGNLSKAALELGMGRSTLYRKMIKYGL